MDNERGMVFLATGNPADSFYGGDRPGTNLYANCILALDAATGKLRRAYQVVHHDIFDYDLPGAPALIQVKRGGRTVPAVAQITKMGLLFILDRLTGTPVFGVEERPVANSDVPGEAAWPTQPFPLKPPPLSRIGITRAELTTRTPEAHRRQLGRRLLRPTACLRFCEHFQHGRHRTHQRRPAGFATSLPQWKRLRRFLDQDHFPCQQPAWGELTAVNANNGEIAWKVTLGNFEELAPQGFKNTGTPNVGGTIATAGGLVFVAATNDRRMRAFESATGRELWNAPLDATGNATPITYLGRDGRQYLVIAAGGPAHLRNVGDTTSRKAVSHSRTKYQRRCQNRAIKPTRTARA